MSWLEQMSRAARINLTEWRSVDARWLPTLSDVIGWWRSRPYRWEPPQSIVSRDEAVRRRYGACGDAAADVAAYAVRRGWGGWVCIEAPEHLQDYAHARVIITAPGSDAFVDVFADQRPENLTPTCDYQITFESLLSTTPRIAPLWVRPKTPSLWGDL